MVHLLTVLLQVPVGGTSPLGAWGYLSAIEELVGQVQTAEPEQPQAAGFDHIVFAAGSGGTATGIAMGCLLAGELLPGNPTVHAVNVQHTPEIYYESIGSEAAELGQNPAAEIDRI